MLIECRDVVEEQGYRVDSEGGVWSRLDTHGRLTVRWRRLSQVKDCCGYLRVGIKSRSRLVHRLVMEHFVGPCPPGMECRHLDGNPANNRLENLAWGTPAENHADAMRHGTAFCLRPEGREHSAGLHQHMRNKRGERHHRAKLTDEQVEMIRRTVVPGVRDGSVARLSGMFGVTDKTIRMIAAGKRRRTVSRTP